jgi:hypothetical protein
LVQEVSMAIEQRGVRRLVISGVLVLMLGAGPATTTLAAPNICVSVKGEQRVNKGSICISDPTSIAIGKDDSIALAEEDSHALAMDESLATAVDNSHSQAKDSSEAQAEDNSRAQARDESEAIAIEDSHAQAMDEGNAVALDDGHAQAKDCNVVAIGEKNRCP